MQRSIVQDGLVVIDLRRPHGTQQGHRGRARIVPLSAPSSSPGSEGPIDAVDYLVKVFHQGPALVKPSLVLPGGLTVVGAQAKAYKSALIAQLAWTRAHVHRWLGFETTPGKTL
jgi:hypothetical protein